MKIYKIMMISLVITFILSSCSAKELTKEEQYQQGIEYYKNIELDKAKDIFILLDDYKNSNCYFYQIVTLTSIQHLDKITNLYIIDKSTTAFVHLKNGDLYYYELDGAENVKKTLISKGGN